VNFLRVVVILTFWFGVYYLIWAFRDIDQGRAVGGAIACLLFGAMLTYAIDIPARLKERQWLLALCSIYITGWFGWLWYITLKAVNNSLISGLPTLLASSNYTGFFGIEGFWGIAVFIPMYVVFIAVLWILMSSWNKFYIPYRYRRSIKRRIEEKTKKKELKVAADAFYADLHCRHN